MLPKCWENSVIIWVAFSSLPSLLRCHFTGDVSAAELKSDAAVEAAF